MLMIDDGFRDEVDRRSCVGGPLYGLDHLRHHGSGTGECIQGILSLKLHTNQFHSIENISIVSNIRESLSLSLSLSHLGLIPS